MATRRAAAEAGITIAANPNRVEVRVDGLVIADSTRALVMRAPGTPDVQYVPRADVDMTRLIRSERTTHCPYKGEASYWSIRPAAGSWTTRCGATRSPTPTWRRSPATWPSMRIASTQSRSVPSRCRRAAGRRSAQRPKKPPFGRAWAWKWSGILRMWSSIQNSPTRSAATSRSLACMWLQVVLGGRGAVEAPHDHRRLADIALGDPADLVLVIPRRDPRRPAEIAALDANECFAWASQLADPSVHTSSAAKDTRSARRGGAKDWRSGPPRSGRDGIPRLLPGLHSALQRLDAAESHRAEPCRLTGGARLVRSGAVEDELLALGQRRRTLLQIAQRDGAIQSDTCALGIVVRAYEQRAPPAGRRSRVRDADPLP